MKRTESYTAAKVRHSEMISTTGIALVDACPSSTKHIASICTCHQRECDDGIHISLLEHCCSDATQISWVKRSNVVVSLYSGYAYSAYHTLSTKFGTSNCSVPLKFCYPFTQNVMNNLGFQQKNSQTQTCILCCTTYALSCVGM